LLATTALVLALSLGLSAWVLDRSFASSLATNAEEQLRLVIFGLMGVVDESGASLTLPDDLSEPRLVRPDSGLYAWVENENGKIVWQSPSARLSGRTLVRFPEEPSPGTFAFGERGKSFHLAYTVIWEAAREARFTFRVEADQAPFRAGQTQFRRNLVVGIVLVITLLAIAQYFAVAWGLKPLTTMAENIHELEAGTRTRLGTDHPPELAGLARNLDRFIVHETESRERYRHAMDDLAHSLKTPLAVLRNALGGIERNGGLLEEQLARMESTVRQQLARAMLARPPLLAPSTPLAPQIDRLVRALVTAYASKDVEVERQVDRNVTVRMDETDLMELLGNVLDNAFKYCRGVVRVTVVPGQTVTLTIEDDGAGIDPALRESVLARGVRADTAAPGQGIGLAIVVDLLVSYGGTLALGDSPLGGAAVTVTLPA
jgi:two-component system sensor histidine kinase PhoQ